MYTSITDSCTITIDQTATSNYDDFNRSREHEFNLNRAWREENDRKSQYAQRTMQPRDRRPQLCGGRNPIAALPRRAPPRSYSFYQGDF